MKVDKLILSLLLPLFYAYNTIGVSTSIKAAMETISLLNIGCQNIDVRGNMKNSNE